MMKKTKSFWSVKASFYLKPNPRDFQVGIFDFGRLF
jgi:hypothetical protein